MKCKELFYKILKLKNEIKIKTHVLSDSCNAKEDQVIFYFQ